MRMAKWDEDPYAGMDPGNPLDLRYKGSLNALREHYTVKLTLNDSGRRLKRARLALAGIA